MGHYPFEWQVQDICAADFNNFQEQFSQTILQLVPFAYGPIKFLDTTTDTGSNLKDLKRPKYWHQYIKRLIKNEYSVVATEIPILFMTVWIGAAIIGIAAV